MEHKKYKELMYLAVMEELGQEEIIELENHLLECSECSAEYDSLKNIHSALVWNRPKKASDENLKFNRQKLFETLRREQNKLGFFQKLLNYLREMLAPGYKIALSGAFTLLIGIFTGWLIFTGNNSPNGMITSEKEVSLDKLKESGMRISNIRFPNPFLQGEEIDISFDIVRPINIKGNFSDPGVQKLLATAMLTSDNAGVKLKTISTLNRQMPLKERVLLDPAVKEALLSTLKVDLNPGVRKEALEVLSKYPFDPDIRNALLFVLENDRNAGIRINAINALAQYKTEGIMLDDNLKRSVRKSIDDEKNEFIKLRAAKIILEDN